MKFLLNNVPPALARHFTFKRNKYLLKILSGYTHSTTKMFVPSFKLRCPSKVLRKLSCFEQSSANFFCPSNCGSLTPIYERPTSTLLSRVIVPPISQSYVNWDILSDSFSTNVLLSAFSFSLGSSSMGMGGSYSLLFPFSTSLVGSVLLSTSISHPMHPL